ncbi:MAG TPA: tetratricopeptide repeat protein [Candidatus Woesebacteria bacterium]|nr:tetratricopeptide repeat protein [Candidatus Woesebacteria bacterium]HNS94947.1 tetratricopeptide repeat protein [Candidatus Woesebacteria bacterium]
MNTNAHQDLETRAVDAAIQNNWQEAVKLNEEILKQRKHDVSTLLRLGFAYLRLGKHDKSLKTYKQVLKIQPQNAIANEYVPKIELQRNHTGNSVQSEVKLDSNVFIELPGKTKSVNLSQLGQKASLARLIIGEEVYLFIRKHHVEVRSKSDEYIGVLPDDVGVRLMYFLENQSEYLVHIQEATLNSVSVFIRERTKGKKVERLVSFPVDIPGSISRVMAYQQQKKDDDEQTMNQNEDEHSKDDDRTNLEDDIPQDEENSKDDDVLDNELIKDAEGDQKPEVEILGINTEEEDEDEE